MTTIQAEQWRQAERRFSARGAVFSPPELGREGQLKRHVTTHSEAQLSLEMACAQRDILGCDVYLVDQDTGIEYGYARGGNSALYLDALPLP